MSFLTAHQLARMDLFGYLVFPGLLNDRIDRIIEEFEAVFANHGGGHFGAAHDGTARSDGWGVFSGTSAAAPLATTVPSWSNISSSAYSPARVRSCIAEITVSPWSRRRRATSSSACCW